jgi:hypothetical protein
MHFGEAEVEEPMWVYLGFMRRFDRLAALAFLFF